MSKLFLTKSLQIFGNVNVNFATEYSFISNSRKVKLWNRQPVGVRTVALTRQVETSILIEENRVCTQFSDFYYDMLNKDRN